MSNQFDLQAKLKPLEQLVKDSQIKVADLIKADVTASHQLGEALQKSFTPGGKQTNQFQVAFDAFQTFGQTLITNRTRLATESYQALAKVAQA